MNKFISKYLFITTLGLTVWSITSCYAPNENPCQGGLWGFNLDGCKKRLEQKEGVLQEWQQRTQEEQQRRDRLEAEIKVKLEQLEQYKQRIQDIDTEATQKRQEIESLQQQIYQNIQQTRSVEREIHQMKSRDSGLLPLIKRRQQLDRELNDLLQTTHQVLSEA